MHIRPYALGLLVLVSLVIIALSAVARMRRRQQRARAELDRLNAQHPKGLTKAEIAPALVAVDTLVSGSITSTKRGGMSWFTPMSWGDEGKHLYALLLVVVLAIGAAGCSGATSTEPVRTIAPRGCLDCTALRPPIASKARP